MKRYSFLCALLLFTCRGAIPIRAAELSFDEGATRRLTAWTAGDSSGVAVLVARDGKVVFQGGFGFADIQKKTPITPETKFRIGSISKQFTAAAVVRLAEEGKLTLSDSLDKYFSSGFKNGKEVTVLQLLTHTSGLHSYTDKPEFLSRVGAPIEPAKLISWFQDDAPDFAPGQGFHYNNSAYFLLGEIVAKVSGKPLGDFLRETFFEPLEMKDTGIFVNSAPPPEMALGYSFAEESKKLTPALDWDMSWAGGAGALYSTVGDLFRWNEALFGGRVLNETSFKAATTPVNLPAKVDGMKYGYGLVIFEIKRLPAIGHGGGLNGWSSDLLRLPEQRCTVVVLANALPGPPDLIPQAISHALAEKLLEEEIKKLPPTTEDTSIDPKTFADYIGRYDYQDAIMTVSVEENTLHAQLTGQPKFRIFPRAKDEFFWKVADAQVAFVRDEKGQVIAARHSQNGNVFTAAKLGEEAMKLTGEQLEPFVGKYLYGLGAVMTVSRDGQQLFAQLTGQPKFPIFPKSDTEFEWRVVMATVQFVKGDDGKVTQAVHRQNGSTINAPRIKGNERAELAKALTFHASFDQGVDADFGLGDKRIYTAASYKNRDDAKPGLHHQDIRVTSGKGRYGAALEFKTKNTAAIYYQAEKNVEYKEQGWSGTVAFWLSLDPDQDLAPGYCDPIQVTDSEYNDAALWVDFSKDEKPRHFRLGAFGDLEGWNPKKLDPDKNPDFNRRLITVTKPPFEHGHWTQVVFTFSGLNANQPGAAKLFLNGQLQATTEPIREKFTWDLSRAAIRLGLNYTGLYDDLAVFNRALTEKEVEALYGLDGGVSALQGAR